MGKLKTIRENAPEWMKRNYLDIFEMLDPTPTKKYVQMIINLYLERSDELAKAIERRVEEEHYINSLQMTLSLLDKDYFKTLSVNDMMSLYKQVDSLFFDYEHLRTISDFIKNHMNNKLSGVDVNQVKSIKTLVGHNSMVSMKDIEKEFQNQVVKLLDNDKWLMIRPITYESSVKYGMATRWCTASRDSFYHFFRYTKEGTLVYIMNKETGVKTAFFMGVSPQSDSFEISFWNAADDRIDSMMSELDNEVMDILKDLIKNGTSSNRSLNVDLWTESELRQELNDVKKSSEVGGEVPVPTEIEREPMRVRLTRVPEPTTYEVGETEELGSISEQESSYNMAESVSYL